MTVCGEILMHSSKQNNVIGNLGKMKERKQVWLHVRQRNDPCWWTAILATAEKKLEKNSGFDGIQICPPRY